MAKFPSLTFTEAGMKMLIQAQNGHTLTFTKGKLGSGVLTDSDDITKFTDLKAPKMELPVVKKDDSQKEKIALTFNTSNTALEEGFVSRELGIFAKLDDGAETLYAYSNAGNDYDYIPNKDTPTDENRLVVNLIVSSSANINALVDGSIVYAHMSDLDERLQVTATADKPASMSDRGLWVEIKDGLKSILHRWNKTTKSYETIHPETESAQITDWHSGIMASLASKTLGTVVDAITTDSVLGKLIKMLLNASGVKYLIDTNGYICFGDYFGGLIIQWGTVTTGTNTNLVHLPVTMQNLEYAVLVQNKGKLQSNGFWQVDDRTVNDFRIYNSMPGDGITWFWECIGK
nr:MAG TPA: tail collar fiber protein [Caudoviricetes sp.]